MFLVVYFHEKIVVSCLFTSSKICFTGDDFFSIINTENFAKQMSSNDSNAINLGDSFASISKSDSEIDFVSF